MIPPQAWLVLILAMFAFGPASYVVRHVRQASAARDVTQPPDDLSWRSRRQLYGNLALLAGLLGAAIFIFTPTAKAFAQSDAFVPAVLGVLGSGALGTVIAGWRTRRIEPLIRGISHAFQRDTQPFAYWASFAWNAMLGCAFLAGSIYVAGDNLKPRCDDGPDPATWAKTLRTCDAMLGAGALDNQRRASLLAARGRIHHRLGNDARALADYSETIKLTPDDSYALFNRALIYSRMGDPKRAIGDLNASIALRPDNDDVYLQRGIAYLDLGASEAAVRDFTTLHVRDPEHPYALANRGIAYAWLGNRDLAERDFARVRPGEPGWAIVLRGRAVLAMHRKDHRQAVDLLSQALKLDPEDRFALRMRADAYWEIGERDLARDDDDRLTALKDQDSVRQRTN